MPSARLAVDIGGTHTGLARVQAVKRSTAKVLTTPAVLVDVGARVATRPSDV